MRLLGGTRISVAVDGLSWTLWFENTEYDQTKIIKPHTKVLEVVDLLNW